MKVYQFMRYLNDLTMRHGDFELFLDDVPLEVHHIDKHLVIDAGLLAPKVIIKTKNETRVLEKEKK
jgi:hypothetical protein